MAGIHQIVIAGGGTSGWLAASAIAKLYGKQVKVTLVDSAAIGRIGVGEATIPPLRNFHRLLAIRESEFMSATQATFKLGIEFKHWAQRGDSYIHSFGITGKDCWACDFHHFWLAGRERALASEFGDYCVELQSARKQRLLPGDAGKLNYAYHVDAGLYAGFLRQHALRHGCNHVDGKIERVEISGSNGYIDALVLEDGARIQGDLFIDCSGFRALLIGSALNVGFESYGDFLPCDSAIAVQSAGQDQLRPYTQAIAQEFGWQWCIPLQNRMGNGLVYSSQYVADTVAGERLLQNLLSEPVSEPRRFRYRPGRRRQAWHKNCVAIGLSGGFLEPVESTSIHLAMSAILRLLKLFPRNEISDMAMATYNAQTREEIEGIRDFIILHYKATERKDSAFWRYCNTMAIPDSLAGRLELFRATGVLSGTERELFQINSWVQVLLGQRIEPTDYHPIVDLMSEDELGAFLQGYKKFVENRVSAFPSHRQAIEQYCKGGLASE
ncbi:tryptophan halogenase family protein [Microbulbifer sp. 2205BS26-8]|uniref:tryptophan halogenase family protein n=1 Tax=Microbulbifer sp. 2205BS26-8 TaxID=3064386 RepID=UPI00273F98B6|nr:tryptophan halogenase family protein [Microbulbifer sp. 2205BS26-8]MDP5209300.1 tryptophan 7-halogenase [Microbulbifer sp. 2205BS26-8]